jgi:hypothetical protein
MWTTPTTSLTGSPPAARSSTISNAKSSSLECAPSDSDPASGDRLVVTRCAVGDGTSRLLTGSGRGPLEAASPGMGVSLRGDPAQSPWPRNRWWKSVTPPPCAPTCATTCSLPTSAARLDSAPVASSAWQTLTRSWVSAGRITSIEGHRPASPLLKAASHAPARLQDQRAKRSTSSGEAATATSWSGAASASGGRPCGST